MELVELRSTSLSPEPQGKHAYEARNRWEAAGNLEAVLRTKYRTAKPKAAVGTRLVNVASSNERIGVEYDRERVVRNVTGAKDVGKDRGRLRGSAARRNRRNFGGETRRLSSSPPYCNLDHPWSSIPVVTSCRQ